MVFDKYKILKDVEFKQILDELQEAWNDEQRRRHEFWAEVDEGIKAEFILCEIIYHSPIYGRHWMCSTQLTRRLLPYVYDQKLGMIAYEKVMIRLTRNDYEPDVCFWRTERTLEFEPTQSAFPPRILSSRYFRKALKTATMASRRPIMPCTASRNTGSSIR